MKKLTICFISLLAVTACEFNDRVENFSMGGLDTLNLDSVVVVDEICTNDDYYDSTLQKWGRNRQTLWGGCTDANPKLLLNDT